ncbi:glycosyltransferase family 4 protein [Paenibacillus wynnii]|uniref:glycosyltransferase family 4 protein n=1 Tax=Paenibacillus wynnii TaxID=268407 RepID=UPI002794A396|nr:glycosyltransferase family 4 protein [Paenibacillus wynnii]MDQ0196269.1 glycosyltransferase involved in cell wall biosynthesis [Paenibacillus wynnii]
MYNIKVITKTRGFWINLFEYKFETIKFHYKSSGLFEVPSKTRFLLHKIINFKVFDTLGLFFRSNALESDEDANFSYNRFLKSDKPYFIGLENPTALVHYSDTRMRTYISKIRLSRYFNDSNLKGIVCLSIACYSTMKNYYDLPTSLNLYQVYPLVEENINVNKEYISRKSNECILECLYISSNFELKGGDDILEAFNKLKKNGYNKIHLNIITKIDSLTLEQRAIINNNSSIDIYDFKFSKKELYEFYQKANILLNPTRMDSFSLVTLEAMKNGCTIVGTDIYAIKEMVTDGSNGFLTQPKYKYWNNENMIDHYIKTHPNKTFNSKYIDMNIIDFLYEKITYLYSSRKTLEVMSMNSFERSTTGEFSNQSIADKWKHIIEDVGV